MKLDLEGAEYEALQGAQRVLLDSKPIVVFEQGEGVREHFGFSPDDLLGLFVSCGYEVCDFFGLSYDSPEAWESTPMWNVLGLPRDCRAKPTVLRAVPKTLKRSGIKLPSSHGRRERRARVRTASQCRG